MASAAVLAGRENEATQAEKDARLDWVRSMRRQFSPLEMLNPDGSIHQDFFKPKRVVLVDDKKWGQAERDLLYKGIEKYGIGKWREMSEELLPKWDDQALRIKASRLMGSQSLARYMGWKGSREAVDAEQKKNKEIGDKLGCWKAGVLVENDDGSVKKYLEQLAAAGQ
ncbi:hypothetical protein WJX72_001961 [[Myrmecia] bisecta]|uniref:Myb-like domain-containing protein n=1 Tax=[Myrmecia] bisecta TaxID=41462 RepID=A0AAW1R4S4_9CHLO